MIIITTLLVAIVAIEHLYILVFEMFLWTKPKTRKIFEISEQLAKDSKSLAALRWNCSHK